MTMFSVQKFFEQKNNSGEWLDVYVSSSFLVNTEDYGTVSMGNDSYVEQELINQSMADLNTTKVPREPDPTMIFNSSHLVSIITYSCLFVLSAAGNLTVLAVILKRRRRRFGLSAIDFMLLHLCIADLIIDHVSGEYLFIYYFFLKRLLTTGRGLPLRIGYFSPVVTFLMMPLEIGWAATVSWRGGDLLCRIMAFFRIFGLYLSSFVLVCLAIDRYMAVAYPLQVLGAGRRGKIMMTTAWILAIFCSLPQVYIFHVMSHPNFPWYTQCVTFDSLPEYYELVYRIFCMLMMYALPFTTIIVFYAAIVVSLQRRTRGLVAESEDGLRRSGLGNLGKAREKTLKMTVAIVVAFFICWTPYYVMCMWYMIDKTSAQVVDQRIQRFLFLFACTNSTVNPIVYGIFHIKATFSNNARQSYSYTRDSVYRSSSVVTNGASTRTLNGTAKPNIPTARSLLINASNNNANKKYPSCQRNTKRIVSWDSTNGRFR